MTKRLKIEKRKKIIIGLVILGLVGILVFNFIPQIFDTAVNDTSLSYSLNVPYRAGGGSYTSYVYFNTSRPLPDGVNLTGTVTLFNYPVVSGWATPVLHAMRASAFQSWNPLSYNQEPAGDFQTSNYVFTSATSAVAIPFNFHVLKGDQYYFVVAVDYRYGPSSSYGAYGGTSGGKLDLGFPVTIRPWIVTLLGYVSIIGTVIPFLFWDRAIWLGFRGKFVSLFR